MRRDRRAAEQERISFLASTGFVPAPRLERDDLGTRRHADPFDRLLVAQAIATGLPVLSADDALDRYAVTRIG